MGAAPGLGQGQYSGVPRGCRKGAKTCRTHSTIGSGTCARRGEYGPLPSPRPLGKRRRRAARPTARECRASVQGGPWRATRPGCHRRRRGRERPAPPRPCCVRPARPRCVAGHRAPPPPRQPSRRRRRGDLTFQLLDLRHDLRADLLMRDVRPRVGQGLLHRGDQGVTSRFAQNRTLRSFRMVLAFQRGSERGLCNKNCEQLLC